MFGADTYSDSDINVVLMMTNWPPYSCICGRVAGLYNPNWASIPTNTMPKPSVLVEQEAHIRIRIYNTWSLCKTSSFVMAETYISPIDSKPVGCCLHRVRILDFRVLKCVMCSTRLWHMYMHTTLDASLTTCRHTFVLTTSRQTFAHNMTSHLIDISSTYLTNARA